MNKSKIYYASKFISSKILRYIVRCYKKDNNDPDSLETLNEYIENTDILKRGDIVNILEEKERYRNDGSYIWDGKKLIDLNYGDYDDYGYVPKEFDISEFGPKDYFSNSIDHNHLISHKPTISKKDIMNLEFINDIEEDALYAVFKDKYYNIVFLYNIEDVETNISDISDKTIINKLLKKFKVDKLNYFLYEDLYFDIEKLKGKKNIYYMFR